MDETAQFIQQMMGLMQLGTQQRAQRQAEMRQKGEMMAVFQNLSQQTTNPQLASGLRQMFAPLTGRSVEELEEFSSLITPSLDTQRAAASARGYATMEDPDREVISRAAAASNLTGQSPFQLQLGQDYMTLPQGERTDAAGVAAGTRLSAPQIQQGVQFIQGLNEQIRSSDAGRELGWANHRLGWAQLMQQGALAQLGLQLDAEKASNAPESMKFSQVLDLITAYGTAQRHFQEQKGKMSDDELQANLNFMRGLEQQLINVGVIPGTPAATGQQMPTTPATPGGVSLPSPIPFADYFRGYR